MVAVVGSHGKTTTTGMLAWALDQAGFEFSYMVGGRFKMIFCYQEDLPQNLPGCCWNLMRAMEPSTIILGIYNHP